MRPIKLCGDIQKAFWQIQIREPGRNSLRFHWIKSLDPNILEIHRFTKLVFRLTQTPFISQGTLKQHFQNYMKKYPKIVKKIQNGMYVNDLASGNTNLQPWTKYLRKTLGFM